MSAGERFFNLFMLPFEKYTLADFRGAVIREASGDVLELGAGTGANFPYYDPDRIRSLVVTDLKLHDDDLKRKLRASGLAQHMNGRLSIQAVDAQDLPFPDSSFDTVVFTLLFCSVEKPETALAEVARVTRQNGRLVFAEHVAPPGRPRLNALLARLTPAWRRISANCHLDRRTDRLLSGFGFATERRLERGVFVAGVARKKAAGTS